MRHIHKFIVLSLVAVFFVPVLTLLAEKVFKGVPNIAYADVPAIDPGGGCGCDSGSSGSSGSCCI